MFIITDRPIILSCYYNHLYKSIPEEVFNPLVIQQTNLFENFNIYLKRGKPYVQKGRNQTEEESDKISEEMLVYNFISLILCFYFLVISQISSNKSEELYPSPYYDRETEKFKSYLYLITSLIFLIVAVTNWRSLKYE